MKAEASLEDYVMQMKCTLFFFGMNACEGQVGRDVGVNLI